MKLKTMPEVIKVLHSYVPQTSLRVNYTLDRMRRLMHELGDPQEKINVIHVAGTSGKTSTCYFIRALLEAAGKRTGLTVSPHIVSVTERVQIDGQPLPEEVFITYLNEFLDTEAVKTIRPMYFELMMAFAYWVFAREGVDYAIIETGLGGLLDGSNVVTNPSKVCVLGDIGFDHTRILGTTLPEIAAQKAGIIQPHNHVLAQAQGTEVLDVFTATAKRQKAKITIVDTDAPSDDILPAFQRRNWRLAYATYEYVRGRDGLPELTTEQLVEAAHQTPPGRLEKIQVGKTLVILDGAHNPQKMQAIVAALKEEGIERIPVVATLLSAPEGKIEDCLEELKPLVSELHVPNFKVVQDLVRTSLHAPLLAKKAQEVGIDDVHTYASVNEALTTVLGRGLPVVAVIGSLYLVSLARAILELEQQAVLRKAT
jgi:dihydrofolate synthase/folylpolyglutamate synthase